MARRVVMTMWGSFGDLHPYLAVALGLRARGHQVILATSEVYRSKIEGENLGFHPVRPDVGRLLTDSEALRRAYDLKTGTEYVVRELVLPSLEQTYQDLLEICPGADLVVSHPLAYAVPLLAGQYDLPWLSVALQPMAFLSTYDPPVLTRAPWLAHLRAFGRLPYALLFRLARREVNTWAQPVEALRRRLGLPSSACNPLLEGSYSPYGTMAWFSALLAAAQPDWPPHTHITGFPFYDHLAPGVGLDPALGAFLDSGEPPVVFTLGSSAVFEAGDFYHEARIAAERLGCRAVLLTGIDPRNRPRDPLPATIFAAEYAPYSELLARAAVTVHQGGIGTTAQALRAGRPMLVVPYSHDQPDNAARVARLGVAQVIPRQKFSAELAAAELRRLLADESCARRAAAAGASIAGEDGAGAACDAIERIAAGQTCHL